MTDGNRQSRRLHRHTRDAAGVPAALLLFIASCSARPTDDDDCVPERPERGIAASHGEPCDLSQGSRASARDRACGYYECVEGIWRDPVFPEECVNTILEPLAGSGGAKYCAPQCLAELGPSTPELDTSFGIVAEQVDGPLILMTTSCTPADDGWSLPPGQTYCVALTTLDGEGTRALDPRCAARGVNAGLEIIGDVEAIAPPRFDIIAYGTYELYPQAPCPGAGDPDDEPRLCE